MKDCNVDLSDGKVLESIQAQEFGLLQAMYPNEIMLQDSSLLTGTANVRDIIHSRPSHGSLSFILTLHSVGNEENSSKGSESGSGILSCKTFILLPELYPMLHPEVSVLCDQISRKAQGMLNYELHKYVSNLELGDMMLLHVIHWIQSNVERFSLMYGRVQDFTVMDVSPSCPVTNDSLSGMWLYMHHIYNKEKRRDIINWAVELSLTGFSLPGKPGVVYVEGPSATLDDYFARLRRLSWQRMTCKSRYDIERQIFSKFQELIVDSAGNHEVLMNMGQFYLFLGDHGLGHMFKELFGIDGQKSQKQVTP